MGKIRLKKRRDDYDKAYRDYLSGLSLSQVAAKVGVTRQCVFKAFVLRGFDLRTVQKRESLLFNGVTYSLRPSGYFACTTGSRNLMHRDVWVYNFGAIPSGWDIHHIDGDKKNNKIENLECLPKSEHTRKYSPHNNQYTKGRVRATH